QSNTLLEMDSNDNITLDNIDKSNSLKKKKIDKIDELLDEDLKDEIMDTKGFDNFLQD
ncbi:17812_t:CDS:1, partial [Dentiscutata erythropus]